MKAYLWRFAQAIGLFGILLGSILGASILPSAVGVILADRGGPLLALAGFVVTFIIEGAAFLALDKDFHL